MKILIISGMKRNYELLSQAAACGYVRTVWVGNRIIDIHMRIKTSILHEDSAVPFIVSL